MGIIQWLRRTRKLCYRIDDRAMRAISVDRMSRCGDMAIRNYPRWRLAEIALFDLPTLKTLP